MTMLNILLNIGPDDAGYIPPINIIHATNKTIAVQECRGYITTRYGPYVCGRAPGHDGIHVAYGVNNDMLYAWKEEVPNAH